MCKSFVYKGKEIAIRHGYQSPLPLNNIQQAHIRGELDVYEPIIAYSLEYNRDGIVISRRRNDLPPIYMQWKQAYAHRKDFITGSKDAMV